MGGNFSSDFSAGLPAGASVYGSAFVDSTGGFADNGGVLKITTADNGQEGSLILDDLDGGAAMTGFKATFSMLIGGGTGADGFSFNFANDLTDTPLSEEGFGSGLTIALTRTTTAEGRPRPSM
jgi:hypothetical protein